MERPMTVDIVTVFHTADNIQRESKSIVDKEVPEYVMSSIGKMGENENSEDENQNPR